MERTKTDNGASSLRTTAKSKKIFWLNCEWRKLTRDLIVCQNPFRLSIEGNMSGAFNVQHFARPMRQYLQLKNLILFQMRERTFLKDSACQNKSSDFSDDPMEWIELLQRFHATFQAANKDGILKTNRLKTNITGKTLVEIREKFESVELVERTQNAKELIQTHTKLKRVLPNYSTLKNAKTISQNATPTIQDRGIKATC